MTRSLAAVLIVSLGLAAPGTAAVTSQHGGGARRAAARSTARQKGRAAADSASQNAISAAQSYISRTGGGGAPRVAGGRGLTSYGGRSGFNPQGASYFGQAGGVGGGTRYQGAMRGETLPPVPGPQGSGVPGALIRTAGLESYHGEPGEPERQFAVAAGPIQLDERKADGSANWSRGMWVDTPYKNPPPNGYGIGVANNGMNPSGNNAITPNGSLYAPGTGPVTGGGVDNGNGNDGQNNGNGNGNGDGGGRGHGG